MKRIIYIVLLSMLSFSCKAQLNLITNQVDIERLQFESNDYFIDSDNLLNPYVGSWLYSDGNTSLKFVLRKATNSNNGYYHQDIIYGECEYIENGVEKMNSLSQIDNLYQSKSWHTISGKYIISKNNNPPCDECNDADKRLKAKLSDEIKGVTGIIYLRTTIVNGQQALSVRIQFEGIKYDTDYNKTYVGSTIPNGYYTLIKQP